MNARRILTHVTAAALPTLFSIVAVASSIEARTMAPEGGWTANGAIEQAQAADTVAAKPSNAWTAAGLTGAGWDGCHPSDDGLIDGAWPTAHVVRMPAAEGFRWVLMTPAEVSARVEGFGGTPTTSDDPKIVGNCYPTAR